jgi:YHS domain-containing protein
MKAMKITLGILVVLAAFGLALATPSAAQACDGCGCDKAKAGGEKAKSDCGKADCDCGCKKGEECTCGKAPKSFASAPAVGTKATCPVMGEEFTVKADSPRAQYKGKHYAFCCAGCKPKFDADPAKFADK